MTPEQPLSNRDQLHQRWLRGEISDVEYRELEAMPRKQETIQPADTPRYEPGERTRGAVTVFPSPSAARPQPGDVIEKYRLESMQRGGMGEVWKAWDPMGERYVALKFLPPELSGNIDEIARLRATFKLVEQLNHPNICRAFDLNENPKWGWFQVMDWVDGETLSSFQRNSIEAEQPLSLPDVINLLTPVADAIDYAHQQRVLHRDIKPQNLMRDSSGKVYVIDFGLAAEVRSGLTRITGQLSDGAGTLPYVSPEQWSNQPVTARSDQFALAVTAYELLAGRRPFDADDPTVLAHQVLNQRPPRIPLLPDESMSALRRGLGRHPRRRFASCRELIEALKPTAERNLASPETFVVGSSLALSRVLFAEAIFFLCAMLCALVAIPFEFAIDASEISFAILFLAPIAISGFLFYPITWRHRLWVLHIVATQILAWTYVIYTMESRRLDQRAFTGAFVFNTHIALTIVLIFLCGFASYYRFPRRYGLVYIGLLVMFVANPWLTVPLIRSAASSLGPEYQRLSSPIARTFVPTFSADETHVQLGPMTWNLSTGTIEDATSRQPKLANYQRLANGSTLAVFEGDNKTAFILDTQWRQWSAPITLPDPPTSIPLSGVQTEKLLPVLDSSPIELQDLQILGTSESGEDVLIAHGNRLISVHVATRRARSVPLVFSDAVAVGELPMHLEIGDSSRYRYKSPFESAEGEVYQLVQNGKQVAVRCSEEFGPQQWICVFQSETGQAERYCKVGHAARLSHDGHQVASLMGNILTIATLDRSSEGFELKLGLTPTALAWDWNNSIIAVGDSDGQLETWDTRSRSCLRSFRSRLLVDGTHVSALTFSPQGKLAVVHTNDHWSNRQATLCLWSHAEPQPDP